jgi:hypothetical protein
MAGFGPADDPPGYASLVSPIVVSQLPQTDVVDLLCMGEKVWLSEICRSIKNGLLCENRGGWGF